MLNKGCPVDANVVVAAAGLRWNCSKEGKRMLHEEGILTTRELKQGKKRRQLKISGEWWFIFDKREKNIENKISQLRTFSNCIGHLSEWEKKKQKSILRDKKTILIKSKVYKDAQAWGQWINLFMY